MAGRIRSIKPEWTESQSLGSCSDAARVLSVSLILLADDYGRGRAHAGYLAGQCWCYSEGGAAKAEAALAELQSVGYVVVYEVDGSLYYQLPRWREHQRVDKPGKPRVPEPSLGKVRESPANVREEVATSQEIPSPDHDHDHEGTSNTTRAREPREKKSRPVELPADWEPTPEHEERAKRLGLEVELEARKFRAHAEANARRAVRWNAAFTGWLENAPGMRGGGARASPRAGGGLTPLEIANLDMSKGLFGSR